MKDKLFGLGLFISLIILTGCAVQPVPGVSPLSSPVVSASPSVQLTPTLPSLNDQNRGGVVGQIVLKDTKGPLPGVAVYLGDYLAVQSNQQSSQSTFAITIQQNSSPHTSTDENGYFAIVNVTPGKYALVLWTPLSSSVIADPQQPTKELQVVIEPGKVINLGEIVSTLP